MALSVSELDDAIRGIIEDGQSFTLGDMTYNAANLTQVTDLRDTVRREESQADGRRPAMRAVNFGGMGY